MTFIQIINPTNKETEKKKFLFDSLYNPQFEYTEPIDPVEYAKYGTPSDKFIDHSKYILDSVLKKFGNEDNYLKEIEGQIISKEEVSSQIQQYLKDNNIEDLKVTFSKNYVARTSISEGEMKVRLPVEYGEHIMQGVLHHEIGTHYFRTLNEQRSPWYKQHKKYGLKNHLRTEEGLAIIHQYMNLSQPYLWRSALYYIAVWYADKMSFSSLAKEMRKYVPDNERLWKLCIRVKRGKKDTSLPGGFSRDQAYLDGIIQVLQYLEKHEYNPEPLYIGKVDLNDLSRLPAQGHGEALLLPKFLKDIDRQEYKKAILRIKKLNFPNL